MIAVKGPERARARYEVFQLQRIADEAGALYVGELAARGSGPFDRFYFVTDVPSGVRRGGHAHRAQSEYLICMRGSVTVEIEAHGARDVVVLAPIGRALYLPPGYWRDLVAFSPDALLAVLASHAFSEADYIRDRRVFQRWEATRAQWFAM